MPRVRSAWSIRRRRQIAIAAARATTISQVPQRERVPTATPEGYAFAVTRARVAEWQTRGTQNPLSERACGFKSHPGHLTDEVETAGNHEFQAMTW